MAQHTVQLDIVKSTFVDRSNPGSNYGSLEYIRTGDGDFAKNRYYAFIDWDHSKLLQRKRIISVELHLYSRRSVTMPTGQSIHHGEIRSSWDENTATYSNVTFSRSSYYGGVEYLFTDNISSGTEVIMKINPHAMSLPYGISLFGPEEPGIYAEFNSTRAASNKPYIKVTYEDVPPDAPTPKSPIGAYKDSKSVTRFEWQYNSDVGGEQKAFDLQWSTDQINWTTVSQTTSNTYYDMPANTLPAGNIYWRVRCYNEYDEVGPYCDIQSFYAVGAPEVPVINAIPTNTARPVVSWSAFSQQVYQLQVLSGDIVVYDSGIVPGISIRQHKIKAWLEDGEYTVQLRTKDEYDLWSDWTSTTVTISTDKPEKPSIALQRSAYGVEITGTGLVYRSDYDKDDYICIGTASGTYFDNTVRSKVEYKYFIRAVSENDTFEDSDIKFIQAEFRHSLIAPVSDLSSIFTFTRSLNTPPKRTYNRQPGGAFVEYAGRKHPVWEPTEHVSAGWTMTFYLKSWAEVEAFVALVDRKETVLYRDARGRKVYGILSNLTIDDERSGYIVSFTLTEVDYIEGVDV